MEGYQLEKIELRLNILQNKIYAAKKEKNTKKVRKLQKSTIMISNIGLEERLLPI